MIIAKIIQNNRTISFENKIDCEHFKYSKNLKMKFERDKNFNDYNLLGFYNIGGKIYRLEINGDDTFTLEAKLFSFIGEKQLSFSLEKDGEVIHLGIITFNVREAFGNTSDPLPEKEELWIELVKIEVNKVLEPALSEINSAKEDVSKKHSEVLVSSREVANSLEKVKTIEKTVEDSKQEVIDNKNEINKKVANFNQKEEQLNQVIDDFNADFETKKKQIENNKADIDLKVENFNENASYKTAEFNSNVQKAVDAINLSRDKSISQIEEKRASAIDDIVNEKQKVDEDIALEKEIFNNLTANSKKEITQLADDSVNAINQVKQTGIEELENTETSSLDEIKNSKDDALKEINLSKNSAVQEVEKSGEHYQEQIVDLQKESAAQSVTLENLKGEVELKLNSPYLNNKNETHITNSDNGLVDNLIIEGNTYQETTKGYQLFDKESLIIDSILEGDGTLTCKANIGYHTTNFIEVNENETYTITATGSQRFKYFKADKTPLQSTTFTDVLVESGATFTIPQDIKYIRFTLLDAKKDTIMLNKGATTQPFEPYTGCQPSPSPDYPQKVKGVSEISGKIVGKNLFDKDDTINGYLSANDIFSSNQNANFKEITSKNYAPIDSSKQYLTLKVKATITNNTNWAFIGFYDENHNYITCASLYDGNNKKNGVIEETMKINIPTNAKYFKASYRQYNDGVLQIEYGQTATDYQPYQSQSFNYNLSNPLHRLSDSVYDYIDVDKGKIIRNVDKYVLKSKAFNDWSSTIARVLFNVPNRKVQTSERENLIYCDKATSNVIGNNNNKNIISGLINSSTLYWYPNTEMLGIDRSLSKDEASVKLQEYLTDNPLEIYYQLATPVEEPLPSDLQSLLQSLKSYYPQTNIMFDTEVEPYINFDYKLNLKSWIEDKDNEAIIYDKKNKEKDKYSSTFFENMFALQRTGKVYTVRFPKFEVSQSTLGEKLDANAGLVCEASTPYKAGRNDYDGIPIFRTFDVNAYVDDEGIIHITAFKGDDNFKSEGKVDVFVLTMSYYEKTWEDDEYWYYSITDLPKDGYTIARECINKDGSIRSYALYSKYIMGDIEGKPYSSKNLIPAYYPYVTISAYHLVDYCRKRGNYYSGGLLSDYKYIWTRFLLKFANTNSQNVLCGVNNYSAQYQISVPEENVKRVILTNGRANYFVEGSCVSIGDWEGATSTDRSNKKCHSIARNVRILSIEKVDDVNTALNLELDEPITTTETTYVTTMHYRSGYSDKILGRDGSLGKDPKSTKYPVVISGIELMVGGYEIPANAMMNILNSNGDREVYVTNNARKLSTNVSENMKNWKKSKFKIQVQKTNTWQYITKMGIDTELGCVLPISAGESGSGSATGFADAIYCDNASSGQREFLLLGNLWYGSISGLSCLSATSGFSNAWWYCLARLSIGAVGGELT